MILHADMDAFYASVEEREQPELRGRPVVVGGTPKGRGVVAAANYVARSYGVRSAMPAAQAKRLCPEAIFVRPRMALYAEESARIREIFSRFTPIVEPLSLDEAFLDVAGCERLFGSARDIAMLVKSQIANELGLVASVGVASTKFVAKIASGLDKPDGLVFVADEDVEVFLNDLPIGSLWGIGNVTGQSFAQLGITTVGELRQQPEHMLVQLFGRQGAQFWRLSRGIDARVVTVDRGKKSISHETTFGQDIHDINELYAYLQDLVEKICARLRRAHRLGTRVHLKIRFGDFRTITRASTLSVATDSTRMIRDTAQTLLRKNVNLMSDSRELSQPLRLLGVGVAGLTAGGRNAQGDLFATATARSEQSLDTVVDSIRARFGNEVLQRGRRPR